MSDVTDLSDGCKPSECPHGQFLHSHGIMHWPEHYWWSIVGAWCFDSIDAETADTIWPAVRSGMSSGKLGILCPYARLQSQTASFTLDLFALTADNEECAARIITYFQQVTGRSDLAATWWSLILEPDEPSKIQTSVSARQWRAFDFSNFTPSSLTDSDLRAAILPAYLTLGCGDPRYQAAAKQAKFAAIRRRVRESWPNAIERSEPPPGGLKQAELL